MGDSDDRRGRSGWVILSASLSFLILAGALLFLARQVQIWGHVSERQKLITFIFVIGPGVLLGSAIAYIVYRRAILGMLHAALMSIAAIAFLIPGWKYGTASISVADPFAGIGNLLGLAMIFIGIVAAICAILVFGSVRGKPNQRVEATSETRPEN